MYLKQRALIHPDHAYHFALVIARALSFQNVNLVQKPSRVGLDHVIIIMSAS
jgi:hypothetical protein